MVSALRLALMVVLATTLLGVYSRLPIYALATQAVVVSVTIGWLLAGVRRRGEACFTPTLQGIGLPVVFYTLTLLATTFASTDVASSLRELSQWLTYLLVSLLAACLYTEERQQRRIAQFLLILGLLMSIVGTYFYWGRSGPGASPVMTSMFGNKNHFAGYLLLVLPLALVLYLRAASTRERVAYGATAILLSSSLFLSYSRGAWFAFAPALLLVVWSVKEVPVRPLFYRGVILTTLTAITVALISLASFTLAVNTGTQALATVALTATGADPEGTLAPRLEYWQGAIGMLRDHLLGGTGLGTFHTVFPEYQRDPRYYSKYAHNFWLQNGAETGVFGLLAGLWLTAAVGLAAFRAMSQNKGTPQHTLAVGLAAGLLASALHNTVDLDWYVPAIAILAAVEVGLVVRLGGTPPFRAERIAGLWRRAGRQRRLAVASVFATSLLLLVVLLQLAEAILIQRGETHRTASPAVAENAWRWATWLNPLDSEPHFHLATLYLDRYFEEGHDDLLRQGVGEATAALERSPRRADYRYMLAQLYLAEGADGPAIVELERVTQLRQPFQAPYAYRDLGRVFFRLERFDEARQLFQRLLDAYPEGTASRQPIEDPIPLAQLTELLGEANLAVGYVALQQGDWAHAQPSLKAAVALLPDSHASNFNLGALYYQQGEAVLARPYLQRAVELGPQHAPSHYYLGLCELALGNKREAKVHLERVLELDPSHDDARRELDKLRGEDALSAPYFQPRAFLYSSYSFRVASSIG